MPILDMGSSSVRPMASLNSLNVVSYTEYDYSVKKTLAVPTLDIGTANVCKRFLTYGFMGAYERGLLC